MDQFNEDERRALRSFLSLDKEERDVLLHLARMLTEDAIGDGGQRNIDYLRELFRRRPEILSMIRWSLFRNDVWTLLVKAGIFAGIVTACAGLYKVATGWTLPLP